MFFAPSKVKSLSQYAEFGVYLQHRHFMIMLCIAFLVHAAVIGIYASLPRQEVLRIPVRVLNIKLGSGIGDDPGAHAPELLPIVPEAPAPVMGMEVRPELKAAPVVDSKKAENLLDQALSGNDSVKQSHPKLPHMDDKAEKLFGHIPGEQTLAVPKRYVRSSEMSGNLAADMAVSGAAGKQKKGNGGSAYGNSPNGEAASEEITQRYEQTISLWLGQHKITPEDARKQGIQGSAVLRIRINRQGKILYSAIDQSSGNAQIDNAFIATVHASDPVPAVPANYPEGEELEFLIPMSFHVQ